MRYALEFVAELVVFLALIGGWLVFIWLVTP